MRSRHLAGSVGADGSGSQVMASVLSLQQGWGKDEQPQFKVNGQFKPLRDSVNAGESTSAATFPRG